MNHENLIRYVGVAFQIAVTVYVVRVLGGDIADRIRRKAFREGREFQRGINDEPISDGPAKVAAPPAPERASPPSVAV